MDNLVKLRKQAGISQSELAEMLGVLQQTISKYENGIREPDNKTLIKLSEIFGCSTDYLLGRTNIRNPYEKIVSYLEEDQEFADLCNNIKKREDLRLLIMQAKDISPNKVNKIIRIIKILEDEPVY